MKKWFPLILGVAFMPYWLSLQGCAAVAVGAAASGVVVATDRRSTGMQVDDKTTAARLTAQINEKYGSQAHINVGTYNGVLLLTGEVPTQVIADDAVYMAKQQEHVRVVQNELMIGEISSLSSRSNDSYITSKVKTRFLDSDFSPTHVKVITERGIVYLMGIVGQEEAKQASEIARKTKGVQRVVTIFEFTDQKK